jgi:hypothetical protein
MTEKRPHNAEEVIASTLSVPINMFIGMASLLISKDIISRVEVASFLRDLVARSPAHGENEAAVRILLESILAQFEDPARGRNREKGQDDVCKL